MHSAKDFNVPIERDGRKFRRLGVRDYIEFGEIVRQRERKQIIADAKDAGISEAALFDALRKHSEGFESVYRGMEYAAYKPDGIIAVLELSVRKVDPNDTRPIDQFGDDDDLYRQITGFDDLKPEPDASGKAASQPSPATG